MGQTGSGGMRVSSSCEKFSSNAMHKLSGRSTVAGSGSLQLPANSSASRAAKWGGFMSQGTVFKLLVLVMSLCHWALTRTFLVCVLVGRGR